MGVEWYDMIARRNGGYKGRSTFITEGRSAEEIFEERLRNRLPHFSSVLDAGCGHGDFTLRMSRHAKKLVGFDNSQEMIKIAAQLLGSTEVDNVEFMYAYTKTEMPFEDGQFDLIYSRRGPTSIINHARLLAPGGIIMGIHSNVDMVKERLAVHGYKDIEIEVFNDARFYFPNEREFAIFLSDVPGNPDYTLPERKEEFEQKLQEHWNGERIEVQELKYIWTAVRPDRLGG